MTSTGPVRSMEVANSNESANPAIQRNGSRPTSKGSFGILLKELKSLLRHMNENGDSLGLREASLLRDCPVRKQETDRLLEKNSKD